jgi:hypothetical protein
MDAERERRYADRLRKHNDMLIILSGMGKAERAVRWIVFITAAVSTTVGIYLAFDHTPNIGYGWPMIVTGVIMLILFGPLYDQFMYLCIRVNDCWPPRG